MVAIQIRNVSEASRDVLAREAKRRNTSLQELLREVVEREAANARRREWLDERRSDANRDRPSVGLDLIVEMIQQVREARGA
ncbi:hypothetical protein [Microcella putealis]|nr:hypothetical protein [Microcella putealis]TQM23403.1 hypothetical protein BJ957_1766 [Microcella putealis]